MDAAVDERSHERQIGLAPWRIPLVAPGALKRYAERLTARIGVWVAAASALVGGCISSSGGKVLDRDCQITWLDDGVMMSATTGNATWASKGGRDSVDMFGANHSAGVETLTPLTAQTYVCGQTTSGQSLLLTYQSGKPAGPVISSESCTVAFTQIGAVGGAKVTGTFEMVLDLAGGGTKTITNGSFELPLSM